MTPTHRSELLDDFRPAHLLFLGLSETENQLSRSYGNTAIRAAWTVRLTLQDQLA